MLACKAAISRSCWSEMRGQASSPAVASSASHTSNNSWTSFCVSFAARDPRFGNSTTSPSAASTFSASRSGVREIDSEAHSSRSGIRAPGGISPSVSRCLRRDTTSSCIIAASLPAARSGHFECKILRAGALSSKILLQKPVFAFRIGLSAGSRPNEKSKLKTAGTQMNDTATLEADLLYEVRDGIGGITFNRPQARNSLTFGMYERLAKICASTGEDRSLKVLILTGAGDKAFASGTDINQFRAFKTPQDAIDYETRIDRVLGTLEQCSVPTIAAINGVCAGGGAGIAACCDIRIGTRTAKFGFPIARTLGNCLSASNVSRLSTLIGPTRLKEIIFTARLIEAEEAGRIGLLNEVVEDLSALEFRADEL